MPPSTATPASGASAPPLPDAAPGLALIKPSVRTQAAYSLDAPATARKLNQNECPYDFPPELKQLVLERAAALPWQRYPEFVPVPLVAALAERHAWMPEGVLVGNGSNELIQATLAVTLGLGDTLVAPSPTFALYRLLAAVAGARYEAVPLGERFAYDMDALVGAVRREDARVVVLNSPNNPTGSVLPDGAVRRLLHETDALVLCDEAYQDFGGPTALGDLALSPRVVVLRTFSKAMGMAGLRFGYALAHPDMAREIAKAKLPYNVNAITLAAAAVAVEHPAIFAERTARIVAERERFLARLVGLGGLTAFPSAANFVLLRCERLPARLVFRRLIEEYGILVRDVSSGAGLTQCLRISIGTAEDMDAMVGALKGIFGAT